MIGSTAQPTKKNKAGMRKIQPVTFRPNQMEARDGSLRRAATAIRKTPGWGGLAAAPLATIAHARGTGIPNRLRVLLVLGRHGVLGRLQRLLGIALLTLEELLPGRLADVELRQSVLVVRDRLRHVELGVDQRHERLHPIRRAGLPLLVQALVRR